MLKKILKNILPYSIVMKIKTKELATKEFKEIFDNYCEQLKDGRFICDWNDINPRLYDNTNYTEFDSHYGRVVKKVVSRSKTSN